MSTLGALLRRLCMLLVAGMLFVTLLVNRAAVDDYVHHASKRIRTLRRGVASSAFLRDESAENGTQAAAGAEPAPSTARSLMFAEANATGSTDVRNRTRLEFMECRLPDLDPWNAFALPYVDKTDDPMKGCKPTFKPITYLQAGYIYLDKEEKKKGTNCTFKCLYPKDDWDYATGITLSISRMPDCDVMEVSCVRAKNPVNYTFLHTQVFRKFYPPDFTTPPPLKPTTADVLEVVRAARTKPPRAQPDVHVLVFDSTSTSQFMRSMAATVHVLRHEMDAVVFPFVNKVGINSRPNGYALLTGRQGYLLEKSPLNSGRQPWKTMSEMCDFYLDHGQYIGYEFKKRGYVSLYSEDWDTGVFNWPNCNGFHKPPADHFMRPFQLRIESKKYRDVNLTKHLHYDICREAHEYQVDYLRDFLDKYPDKPVFSLSWFTGLAHNNVNGLFHVDLQFQKFFRSYRERLSNSFIFVMGDHGYRFGRIRHTKTGEAEDNNPLLMVVVPEHLRANENLMRNMKRNAKQMTTHFDTFATFVNIVRDGDTFTPNTTFGRFAPQKYSDLHVEGESLLHPFRTEKPRNCENLHVPFDFCNCQMEQRNISTERAFALSMGEFAVEVMNRDLRAHNHTTICAPLALNKRLPIEVIEFEPKLHFNSYKLTFQVTPGDGQLWGYVQMVGEDRNATKPRFSMISERFLRLDEYEPTAFCSSSPFVKPYCYCYEAFSLTSSTSTPTMRSTTTPAATTAKRLRLTAAAATVAATKKT